MTVFNTSLELNKPVGADDPKQTPTFIRLAKQALAERMNVDHDYTTVDNKVDGVNVGTHRRITFTADLPSPDPSAGTAVLYPKLIDGRLELCYKNQNLVQIQLTKNGVVNATAAALAGLFDDVTITMIDGKLAIKPGSITATQMSAGIADGVSLTINGDGKLCIKDGGVWATQLAPASVTRDKIVIPVAGASAYKHGIPLIASGAYPGDGTGGSVFTPFVPGVEILHLLISNVPLVVEYLRTNDAEQSWKQSDGSDMAASLTVAGNQFTVSNALLPGSDWFYWLAYGVWSV
jgi:hypothetical protein